MLYADDVDEPALNQRVVARALDAAHPDFEAPIFFGNAHHFHQRRWPTPPAG